MINLNPAHAKAKEALTKINPQEIAKKADVKYDDKKNIFTVPFLGRDYYVAYPDGDIFLDEAVEVPLVIRVCLLHYLTQVSEANVTGKYISFKELPSGSIYVGPFYNRSIRPLISAFGSKPQLMVAAGLNLGGRETELGDYAVTIKVFPKIPLTFVIWEGDDEFEPSGNILYDSSACFHLETEDYALLPGLIISELRKAAGV